MPQAVSDDPPDREFHVLQVFYHVTVRMDLSGTVYKCFHLSVEVGMLQVFYRLTGRRGSSGTLSKIFPPCDPPVLPPPAGGGGGSHVT